MMMVIHVLHHKRSLLAGTHEIQHRNSTVESRYPALNDPIGLASPFCQLRGTLVFDSQLTKGEIAPTRQLPPYLQQPILPKPAYNRRKRQDWRMYYPQCTEEAHASRIQQYHLGPLSGSP